MLNGFSKGYAMTGFRVAYACANKKIIEAMTKIHSFSMLCGPILSQVAATEALRCAQEVTEMRQEYKRRRDFMFKELNRIGLACHLPTGAFYCFPSIKKSGLSSLDFARRLLFEEKVAVVPGTAFGEKYGDFVRMSYATSFDNLKEAIIRMERFMSKLD
jgi:aminotransferase